MCGRTLKVCYVYKFQLYNYQLQSPCTICFLISKFYLSFAFILPYIIHSIYLLVMWLTILQVHNWDKKNLILGKFAIVNWISFEKTELWKSNVSYVVLPLRCPWTIWHLHILVMQIWEKNKIKMFWPRHLICIGMPHAELMKWHLAWTLRRHAKLQRIQMENVRMRVVHCSLLNASWCKNLKGLENIWIWSFH